MVVPAVEVQAPVERQGFGAELPGTLLYVSLHDRLRDVAS